LAAVATSAPVPMTRSRRGGALSRGTSPSVIGTPYHR
jgi:hypothetical protein